MNCNRCKIVEDVEKNWRTFGRTVSKKLFTVRDKKAIVYFLYYNTCFVYAKWHKETNLETSEDKGQMSFLCFSEQTCDNVKKFEAEQAEEKRKSFKYRLRSHGFSCSERTTSSRALPQNAGKVTSKSQRRKFQKYPKSETPQPPPTSKGAPNIKTKCISLL